jgi:hypothetical protein
MDNLRRALAARSSPAAAQRLVAVWLWLLHRPAVRSSLRLDRLPLATGIRRVRRPDRLPLHRVQMSRVPISFPPMSPRLTYLHCRPYSWRLYLGSAWCAFVVRHWSWLTGRTVDVFGRRYCFNLTCLIGESARYRVFGQTDPPQSMHLWNRAWAQWCPYGALTAYSSSPLQTTLSVWPS